MKTKFLLLSAVASIFALVVFAPRVFAVSTINLPSNTSPTVQLNGSGNSYFNAGNVGIGTTAPAYTLDVNGVGNFTGVVNVGTPVSASNAATKSYVDSAVASGVNGGVNGTANYFPIFTGTNTIGNSVVYQSGGNVGIGTTAPGGLFDVEGGAVRFGGMPGTYNTGYGGVDIRADPYHVDPLLGVTAVGGTGCGGCQRVGIKAQVTDSAPNSTNIALYTNASGGAANYGIYSNSGTNFFGGNVGIGTTAPAYNLDVAGTGNFMGVVNVGTPTAASNAATKSYVDSAVASGVNGGVNGTANYFPIFTGTNTIGNSVVYQSGGNVGIGTTAPNGKLEVFNSGDNGDGIVITPDGNMDNNTSIQTYIDASLGGGGWANRVGYAGGCCNNLALQPDIGTVSIGEVSGNFGTSGLYVNGTGNFTGVVNVGTPTAASNAATKSYVDSAVSSGVNGGGVGSFSSMLVGSSGSAAVNINGNQIWATNNGSASALYLNYSSTGDTLINVNGGNVGIGTTAPGTLLQVGNGGAGKLTIDSTDSSYGEFQIGNPTNNGEASMAFISGVTSLGGSPASVNGTPYVWDIGAGNFGIGGSNFGIGNASYGSDILTITSGGNVGIGTEAPADTLDVNGIGNFNELYTRDNVYLGYLGDWLSNRLNQNVGSGASPTFASPTFTSNVYFPGSGIWNSSGKVGINNNAPAYTLDVNGTGNFTGVVNVGTPTAASNAATKAYVDSSIPPSFPNYSGCTVLYASSVYQAPSNGFIDIVAQGTYENNLMLYAGPNSPSTLIAEIGNDFNGNTWDSSINVPIKKGAWYEYENPGPGWSYGYETVSACFYPAD